MRKNWLPGDALDKTAAFSLRQHFPDAFDGLSTGQSTFVLRDSDFPPDITDLKVKAIVAQALDTEGKGVESIAISFRKEGTSFANSKVTGAGGFTEDVNAKIPFVPQEEECLCREAGLFRLTNPRSVLQAG